ncbi:prophage tail gpP-like protein [Pedobacter sp. AK013]|uniref:hypothetical protein n=1 Tax=Pedobacter sp. AK013 TaxID=2723071 RepID=UPI00161CB320|nr:hypothetical protein [Pedobacter sp. AK013]MBB6236482.1 prophage tail gpP-like protein [Pedobacter sp. AK013]
MKIKVNGNYYLYFNDFAMSSSLDSVASTFSFTARFDPADEKTKPFFKPLSYFPVEFFTDRDELVFSGTMVTHSFASASVRSLVQISGYSKGGVLEDCTIDAKMYPLESINRTIKDIAERLLSPFGLKLNIYDNVKKECNTPFLKSVAKTDGKISEYLAKMCAQKNVIVSHNSAGEVVLFRPDAKASPKAFFNKENTLGMKLDVNGQSVHSTLTSLRQPAKQDSTGLFDDEETSQISGSDRIVNKLVGAYRPFVQVLTSGNQTDTDSGVKNAFAAELKNIKVSFSIRYWADIRVGDIVEIENDEIYIGSRSRMMVADTSIMENSEEKSMDVTLVLPETFTGDSPKNIFS